MELLQYLRANKGIAEESLLENLKVMDLKPSNLRELKKLQGQLVVLETILHEDFFSQLIEVEDEESETVRLSRDGTSRQ